MAGEYTTGQFGDEIETLTIAQGYDSAANMARARHDTLTSGEQIISTVITRLSGGEPVTADVLAEALGASDNIELFQKLAQISLNLHEMVEANGTGESAAQTRDEVLATLPQDPAA